MPTHEQVQKQLDKTATGVNFARTLGLISGVLAIAGVILGLVDCPPHVKEIKKETTGPGVVRYYDASKRTLMHENSAGYVKMLAPLCDRELGAWTHMYAEIKYHWQPFRPFSSGRGPDYGEECYQVDEVKRLGPDWN